MSRSNHELLVDGYISRAFHPNKDVETYFSHLLKLRAGDVKDLCLTIQSPSGSGEVFVIQAAPRHLQSRPTMFCNRVPVWLLDYVIKDIGTVVPQTLYIPHNRSDYGRYVEEAELQMPIFFVHENGDLGLPLEDAISGQCHTLRHADTQAQLGGRSTTHIRILWPGYQDFKRQVQIRDETPAHNQITLKTFVRHVGRSVEAFLRNPVPKENPDPSNKQWRIGHGGVNQEINRTRIIIIGAVHVSAGTWMPILQLDFYVLYFAAKLP